MGKNRLGLSLLLKDIVIIAAIVGTAISALASENAFMGGIGYLQGWEFAPGYNYPYFFLNWGSPAGAFGFSKELPFMGVAWWILAIMIFLLIIGYLYLKILDGVKSAYKKKRGQL